MGLLLFCAILLGILTLIMIVGACVTDEFGFVAVAMFSAIACVLCIAFCNVVPNKITDVPMEYEVVVTSKTVYVETANGLQFQSQLKEDFDNWTTKKQGYVHEEINVFDKVIKRHFFVK